LAVERKCRQKNVRSLQTGRRECVIDLPQLLSHFVR
jgi:hypothetical protein